MAFSRFWNCARVPNRPWHLTCRIRCMVRIILIENPWTQYLIAYAWTTKLNQDFKAKLHHHLSFTKSSKLKYIYIYIYISYIYIYLIYIYISYIYIYIYIIHLYIQMSILCWKQDMKIIQRLTIPFNSQVKVWNNYRILKK